MEHRPAAYVLLSSDGTYRYKGCCRDLVERMKQHHAGKVSRTKNRRPLKLLHSEYFDSYTDARKRELYFKSGAGREWLLRRYP
ncbi:MAG: GIY-YIG nuclease family protein [Kiritimatiellales bacterium]|nr:GIY-YIG nuclease family protein [Kiritimatiellales bacterium]